MNTTINYLRIGLSQFIIILKIKIIIFIILPLGGMVVSVPVEKNYEGDKNRRIEFRILNNKKY